MGVLISRTLFRMLFSRFFDIISSAFLCVALASCGGSDAPDVNPANIKLSARRFDRDLAALDTANLAAGLRGLEQRYPDFLGFYLDTLMGFRVQGNYADSTAGIREGVRSFLTYPDYRGVFDTVAAHFPDTKKIEDDLRKGIAYYKHYFPQGRVPSVVYFISGLNSWNAITYGDLLGIGLDMYLGKNYPFYAAVGIPVYTTRKLEPEYIPVDAFRTLYRDAYPFETDGRQLLRLMIERGKEQYFLQKVLPFVHDSLRLGYTAPQLEWCRENEASIYNFFIAQNLLYETNLQKILRHVTDGPTAVGFPAEAPGSVGTFMGLRIVEAWMDRHEDVTLAQLLSQTIDAQQFLQESGYKPR